MKTQKRKILPAVITAILNILFIWLFLFGKGYSVKGIAVSSDGRFAIAMPEYFGRDVTVYFYDPEGVMINKIHTPYVRGGQVCLAAVNDQAVVQTKGERSFIYDMKGSPINENGGKMLPYFEFPDNETDRYPEYEKPLSDSIVDLEYQYKADDFTIQYGHNKYNEEEIWFGKDGKIIELTIDKIAGKVNSVIGLIIGIFTLNGIIIYIRQLCSKVSDRKQR